MLVIVAHPSPIANARLRRGLAAMNAVSACHSTTGLTDTYNQAEHMHPDCVVMALELAATPEFELLSSLFKIMGICCVLLGRAGANVMIPSTLRSGNHIVRLPADAQASEILEVIRTARTNAPRTRTDKTQIHQVQHFDPKSVILIGASTGGVDALLKTVRHFSHECPPTLIVQHTGENFVGSLIRLLDGAAGAKVVAAEDGAPARAGHIYLSPHNRMHLGLSPSGGLKLALVDGDLVSGHRPSVDILFGSAKSYARHVAAALLTGMGQDGARGMVALRNAGAQTFGQDAATSVVYGMPRVAMEMGGVATQLPLAKIGPALLDASTAKVRS